jgi:hypothetical protein
MVNILNMFSHHCQSPTTMNSEAPNTDVCCVFRQSYAVKTEWSFGKTPVFVLIVGTDIMTCSISLACTTKALLNVNTLYSIIFYSS